MIRNDEAFFCAPRLWRRAHLGSRPRACLASFDHLPLSRQPRRALTLEVKLHVAHQDEQRGRGRVGGRERRPLVEPACRRPARPPLGRRRRCRRPSTPPRGTSDGWRRGGKSPALHESPPAPFGGGDGLALAPRGVAGGRLDLGNGRERAGVDGGSGNRHASGGAEAPRSPSSRPARPVAGRSPLRRRRRPTGGERGRRGRKSHDRNTRRIRWRRHREIPRSHPQRPIRLADLPQGISTGRTATAFVRADTYGHDGRATGGRRMRSRRGLRRMRRWRVRHRDVRLIGGVRGAASAWGGPACTLLTHTEIGAAVGVKADKGTVVDDLDDKPGMRARPDSPRGI